MTMNEYLEYVDEKKYKERRAIRSRRAPTRFSSFETSFQPPRLFTNNGSTFSSKRNEVDIDYERYMANQCRRESSLNNYACGFTSNFNTPDPHPEDRDLMIAKGVDELFRIGAENLRRMEQKKIHNGCNKDVNHDCKDPFDFAISSIANIFSTVCEQDTDNSAIDTTIEEEEVKKEYDEWMLAVQRLT